MLAAYLAGLKRGCKAYSQEPRRVAKRPKPPPGELIKFTAPPFGPHDLGLGGVGHHLIHIRFGDEFVYGIVPTHQSMSVLKISSTSALKTWVETHFERLIKPEMDAWGRQHRLIILDVAEFEPPNRSDVAFTVFNYAPLPEERTWRLAHVVDFYYFPPIWVIESAEDPNDRSVDLKKMREQVYFRELPISKIGIASTCDGLFSVDFLNWPPGRIPDVLADNAFDVNAEERQQAQSIWISVCNVFQVCLFVSVLRFKRAIHRPFPLFPSRTQRRKNIQASGGGGSCRAHLGLDDARRSPRANEQSWMDWRIGDRSVFPPASKEALDLATDTLDKILNMPPERGLRRVEFYSSAAQHFAEGNFSLSVMQSWPVIESLLFELWRGFLGEVNRELPGGAKLINGSRMKLLTEKDMTASMVTALLVTVSKLDPELATRCDKVRVARNNLMHELKTPARAVTHDALLIAESMMRQILEIDLAMPHQVSVQGSAHAID